MKSKARFGLAASLAIMGVALAAQRIITAPDFSKNRDEAVGILQRLIRIDTSNPPGNETKVAEYIKTLFDREGIQSEILATDPARANLVARLKGNGSKRPLLIMGHSDVVGVEREKWTVDPFGGAIEDGYIYGRGAVDDKDNLAVAVQVMLRLHRQKTPLDRDVILLVESGEEGTTTFGIEFMVNTHWDKIDAELALLEGGGMILDSNGKLASLEVSTTEKVPHTTRLVARGTSGHGSIPRVDNPVVHLAAAIARVGAYQSPMRLNDTTRNYFRLLATISSPEDAFLYTHLEDPAVQEKIRQTKMPQSSMLRTSISPTIVSGGFRRNVIPGDAEATLDVRALPGEDMTQFFAALRRAIDDPAVEVVAPARGERPSAPPSRLDSELFRAIERAGKKVFPQAVTVPTMLNGATDGAYLRARGVQAYGVGSINENRAHGNDERVGVENLGQFLEYVHTIVVDVAGAKN